MNKECIRVVNCTWHDAVREGLIKLLLSSSRISARMNDLIHSTVDSRRLIIIVRSKLGKPIFSKIKPVWKIFAKNLLLRLQWRIEFHHATLPQEISVRPLSFTRDFDDLFFSRRYLLKIFFFASSGGSNFIMRLFRKKFLCALCRSPEILMIFL